MFKYFQASGLTSVRLDRSSDLQDATSLYTLFHFFTILTVSAASPSFLIISCPVDSSIVTFEAPDVSYNFSTSSTVKPVT